MSEKKTGIVRLMDDLGRLIIPSFIREEIGFETGKPYELLVDKENERVIFEHASFADFVNHKRNTLFFTSEEFDKILKEVFACSGKNVKCEYELDGITISDEDDVLDDDILYYALAKHFGVATVTSIHIDDCEEVGVWVVYK